MQIETWRSARSAIEWVSDDWVTKRSQVDADLMAYSGRDGDPEYGVSLCRSERHIGSVRLLPLSLSNHPHKTAAGAARGEARSQLSAVRQAAFDHGKILFLDRTGAKL